MSGAGLSVGLLALDMTENVVPYIPGEEAKVETEDALDLWEARHVMASYGADFHRLDLPTSPSRLIEVLDDPFRPQPRLDRNRDGGMTVTVGRLRGDPTSACGLKYVALSHNTRLGAAGGAVQTAEYLVKYVLRWV